MLEELAAGQGQGSAQGQSQAGQVFHPIPSQPRWLLSEGGGVKDAASGAAVVVLQHAQHLPSVGGAGVLDTMGRGFETAGVYGEELVGEPTLTSGQVKQLLAGVAR